MATRFAAVQAALLAAGLAGVACSQAVYGAPCDNQCYVPPVDAGADQTSHDGSTLDAAQDAPSDASATDAADAGVTDAASDG